VIAAMRAEVPALSVRQACALAGAGRTWWYTRPCVDVVALRDVDLRDAIEHIVLDFPGYGYRRVTKTLQRAGWTINHKRVLRVMRKESLLCQLERHWVTTTQSGHGLPCYPNLIRGMAATGPNQIWQADITYIRLPTTFVYLACVLDAWSRKVIGWHLSRTIDTTLTLTALEGALHHRQPGPGFIHHSDRGVQYASYRYVDRLTLAGAQISMSAVGNPYDNARAESFFKTLKREEVYLKQYATYQDAQLNLRQFIDDTYNARRLHSRIGYVPPNEFERNDDLNHTI
jgi:putative transposase